MAPQGESSEFHHWPPIFLTVNNIIVYDYPMHISTTSWKFPINRCYRQRAQAIPPTPAVPWLITHNHYNPPQYYFLQSKNHVTSASGVLQDYPTPHFSHISQVNHMPTYPSHSRSTFTTAKSLNPCYRQRSSTPAIPWLASNQRQEHINMQHHKTQGGEEDTERRYF